MKLKYELLVLTFVLRKIALIFMLAICLLKDLEDELKEVQYEIDRIDVVENDSNSKNHPRLKQISLGKKKFNMDYKKGMEFLIENNLVENTPDAVAQFLFSGEGLNKTSIGNYLGEK
jgi:cytohesin